jgi:hypothetical protein
VSKVRNVSILDCLARILITVDPIVTPQELKEHAKLRAKLLSRKPRAQSEKHLQLAVFAVPPKDPDFQIARLAAVIGAPNSICITPGPNQVLFVGESTFPGRIFKVALDGKVLGVIGRSGRQLKQFSGAHQLACPSENEVYVAETSNWRVQKLILHP